MNRLTLLCFFVLLCACTRTAESPAAIPTEPPYLRGTITAMDDGEIRVEADPDSASGSAKAALRMTEDTEILWRTGDPADFGDLRLGTVVSAWVTGPIRESYPVQATAATVVIESTTRPAETQAIGESRDTGVHRPVTTTQATVDTGVM